MDEIKFVHISDTHIRSNYGGSEHSAYLKHLTTGGKSPADTLKEALEHIRETHRSIDFMLVTGDLCHEGGKDDYALLKSIMEEHVSCPIFMTLGNHDAPEPFRHGYMGIENSSEVYFYESLIKGYKIAALDTSGGTGGSGAVSLEQLERLKTALKEPAANGSLLILHHAPTLDIKNGLLSNSLTNPEELYDCIKDSDIRAIFSGHTHRSSAKMFGTIPHYTADSTAFGVGFEQGHMLINNRLGYSYCTMNKTGVYVENHALPAHVKTIYKTPSKISGY